MDKKLFGKRVNVARKERGMTSEKLSEACDINATYLRQIEAGVKVPSLPVFVTLCQQLKVSPSYLLSDVLADSWADRSDDILRLWQNATPAQLKLIAAIIKAALETMEKEKNE